MSKQIQKSERNAREIMDNILKEAKIILEAQSSVENVKEIQQGFTNILKGISDFELSEKTQLFIDETVLKVDNIALKKINEILS